METSPWKIELECPQCGAPVSLEETDRLLVCSYCHVKLYLWTPDHFCYCLPPLKASSESLLFIPYWRFRGIAYSVIPFEVRHRILDATLLAYPPRVLPDALPMTLGIRPQALKLRFVSGEIQGRFIKPEMPLQEAVLRIQNQFEELEGILLNRPPFHREFIGELGSLIYLPVFMRNGKMVDGILGKVMGPAADLRLDESPSGVSDHWQIKPMSTLCPNCGNGLLGGRESLLLLCKICHVAWSPSSGRLVPRKIEVVPRKGNSSTYLPFWRMKTAVEGLLLKSYADLARAANIPKMVRPEWEGQEIYFWVPAFRLHPSLFLRLSKQMTLFQPFQQTEAGLPNASFHPVTLSEESASASLKVHLAHLLTRKREHFPRWNEISIRPVESTLVYIPFNSTGRELVHPQLGIGLQTQNLFL